MKRTLYLVVVFGILLATIGGWYAWHVRETTNAAVGRLRALSGQVGGVFASSSTDDGPGADRNPVMLPDATIFHQACQDIGELDRTVRPLGMVAGLTAPIARAGQSVSSRSTALSLE